MRIKHIIITVLVILGISAAGFGQQHTDNKADQTLRGSGRVNPSTLGMEFEVPLGNYSGREINVPIGLSYSSKVWRMDSSGRQPKAGPNHLCVNTFKAKFSENSASGWNTTMQEAYIEYSGSDNLFNGEGFPLSNDCPYDPPSTNNNASYIRRIQVHLPSGESHELRLDDEPKIYNRSSSCGQPNQSCDPNQPTLPENWTGWYYATDGSNIKYYENRTNNTYYLGLPDGSYYEFSNNMSNFSNGDRRTIRKATRFIDRHGNFNTYHESTTLFPNGYWTDTIGRNLGVPLPRTAPPTPGDQTYTMPGLTGSSPVSYTFYWKKLKDTSASTSALTDFSQDLKFLGAHSSFPHSNSPTSRPSALFGSDYDAWVIDTSTTPFNPVLLTAIKLPSGQMYKFSYNIYGEIDKVYYPTGGEEKFEYEKVPALTQQDQPNIPIDDSNRGVVNRKVYENSTTATPYQSTYSATWVAPHGYKLTVNNPDGTRSERFLHQGNVNQNEYQGDWGFDNGLAGMAYEERSYSSTGLLTNRNLSRWEVSMPRGIRD
jgi:hypothetical protein